MGRFHGGLGTGEFTEGRAAVPGGWGGRRAALHGRRARIKGDANRSAGGRWPRPHDAASAAEAIK